MRDDHSHRTIAIFLMILSSASFAIMAATVKFLPADVPVVLKVSVRNLISLFVALILAHRHKAPLFGTSRKGRFLLLARSSFGLCGVFLFFFAIARLPLADSALFMRLSPFWVTILAFFFLNEQLHKAQIIALFLAFGGAVMIFRPFSDIVDFPLVAGLAALVASLCAGSAYTLVSTLKSYERPETIVFVFSLLSIVVMAPFAVAAGYLPSVHEWWLLGLIGLSAASGQMLLTYSYRLGKASEVSIFNYMGIPISALFGFLLWSEIPDSWTIVGALLILSAGFLVYFSKRGKNAN